MADDQEFAAVGADEVVPELVVKEGEDIDYRVVLCFYLLADLGGSQRFCTCSSVPLSNILNAVCTAFVICFFFAREEGYWVVTLPFLPLTIWMALKVR